LDAFTTSTGTGGTYAGIAQYLKEKNPKIQCYVADPPGSVLYAYITTGKIERTGTGSITEGIGQGRITENMKNCVADGALHITDEKTIEMVYKLLYEEGKISFIIL
jgi:cysteine synthase A